MRQEKPQVRYGIAEVFGWQVDLISKADRESLIRTAIKEVGPHYPECPFRLPDRDGNRRCTKQGGICSIRKYRRNGDLAERLEGNDGSLTVTCPHRLYEGGEVFKWIGHVVFNSEDVLVVKEVPFLQGRKTVGADGEPGNHDAKVGQIDMILVDRRTLAVGPLAWCAVEAQAVYFSGPKMKSELVAVLGHDGATMPFPNAVRRPDYRSSAPKRLMPQLQIKVPSLRRWGKKMAVVVDRSFFEWLGDVDEAEDMSNADILWFVVEFDENLPRAKVRRGRTAYTTLENAIDSLTGGVPVSMHQFERWIRERLARGDVNDRFVV